MNELENQIKEFLLEVSNKYKNISDDEQDYNILRKQLQNEVEEFFYNNSREINKLSNKACKSIEYFAVNLGNEFKSQWLGRTLWYHGVIQCFENLPKD